MPYPERLKCMKLQSIQRRFDRYRITYVRKILKGLVPNPGISIRTDHTHRLGITVEVPKINSKLRGDSFMVRGPLTFNAIPKELRDTNSTMETFKNHLDEYLSLVPDIPRTHGGGSNRLEEQIRNWKWTLR